MLLDFYKNRFGAAVKKNGSDSWNGPCPLCGGTPGKSDRFVVWPDDSEKLGKLCADNNIRGRWYCRQCNATGDTIGYLTQIDGMDFKSALDALGLAGKAAYYPKAKNGLKEPEKAVFKPLEFTLPGEKWTSYAEKLAKEARESISYMPGAVKWLAMRGIDSAAIAKYGIGYLFEENQKYHGRFRARQALGLEPKKGEDGKLHERIFIPRGIVIPTYRQGRIINLRLRREKADIAENKSKYLQLEGSCNAPMFLRSSMAAQRAVYFVVEAELDAILIHYLSGGMAGAVAVRTNRGKPDKYAHELLKDCAAIAIALDFDDAGIAGLGFWKNFYSQARVYPVPKGKDPGDAFGLGLDLRRWIAGILPCMRQNDPLPTSAVNFKGEGEQAQAVETGAIVAKNGANSVENEKHELGYVEVEKNGACELAELIKQYISWRKFWFDNCYYAQETDFSQDELSALKSAIAKGTRIEDYPWIVCKAWLKWRNLKMFYMRKNDTDDINDNTNGFTIDPVTFGKGDNAKNYYDFLEFISQSALIKLWLLDHPADLVNSANFLKLYEYLQTNINSFKEKGFLCKNILSS